jgi:hypothetical protein
MKTFYSTLVLFFLTITFCFSQNSFKKAYSELFTIDSITNEVEYLHFKIQTSPEYYESSPRNILTDIYYSIKYREYGTPDDVMWVQIYDGHLVNDLEKEFNHQWKGPFPGNRDISYKFLFELVSEPNQNSDKLNITIFSTNPVLDFKYCNFSGTIPFQVSAVYYNTKNLKMAIDVFTGCSTIHTAYELLKSSNIATTIGTAILEEIVVYAIKAEISNLPVYLTIKCNICGKTETIKINNLNYSTTYTCATPSCHNSAKIKIVE